MAITLETVLAPISEDNPVGEDLSYDNGRAELEQIFQVEDSLDGSETVEPDWRGALRLIEAQFERTKDIWLAVYLARAGAGSGSLETTELGVQALAGLLETYWPSVHPQLEELGVPGRKAPCDSLVNRRAFLGPLERMALIAHPRLGRFSGADLERFRLGGASEEGYGMFRAALDELGPGGLQDALDRVASIEAALRRADRAFMAGAEGEESPNYQAAYAVLGQLAGALRSFIPDAASEAAVDEAEIFDGGGQRAERSVSGAVNSREDVVRVLDLIADYYRRHEPSHPMPVMIERAKAWVGMDYLSLMIDIAPNGLHEARGILALREE